MTSSLPTRQRRALDLIQQHLEQTGRPPTGPELAERLGITHQSAYRYLRTLEQKGYIALEQPGQRKPLQIRMLGPARLLLRTAWPRLGAIPAGPMDYLAGEDVEHLERLDDLLPDLQPEDFFLEVSGDSMEGAGLVDGMVVVIRPTREPGPAPSAPSGWRAKAAHLSIFSERGQASALSPTIRATSNAPSLPTRSEYKGFW